MEESKITKDDFKKDQIPMLQAICMNRKQRRKLGKINGVKIPSVANITKVKQEIN